MRNKLPAFRSIFFQPSQFILLYKLVISGGDDLAYVVVEAEGDVTPQFYLNILMEMMGDEKLEAMGDEELEAKRNEDLEVMGDEELEAMGDEELEAMGDEGDEELEAMGDEELASMKSLYVSCLKLDLAF